MSTASDPLLEHLVGGVLTLTLNRPERKNAINDAMMKRLLAVVADLPSRDEVRIVVLRGADATFCAGGDLVGFKGSQSELDAAAIAADNRQYGTLLTGLRALPQVLIVVVEGAAIGGGVGLASVGDVTIAAASAKFATTETSLGLVPAQIAAFIVDRIGEHAGRKLMLLGARTTAVGAQEIGLVDVVADDVEAALAESITTAKRCAPGAVAATKALLAKVAITDRDALLDEAADVFAAALAGGEAEAGLTAFVTRGTPYWTKGA